MNEIKIRLSLTIPGRVMLSQQIAEKNEEKLMESHRLHLNKKETAYYKTRKTVPAVKVVQINKDAYNYMLETPINPKYRKFISRNKTVWDTFTERKKLSLYFDILKEENQALDYSFEILED